MYNNIFETVVRGSNTVYLDIPEDDYFLSYEDLNFSKASDLALNYFKIKGKDGIPVVKDVARDLTTRTVKITVEIQPDRYKKKEFFHIPDLLNIKRK